MAQVNEQQPTTRYARSGSVSIAYQVIGDGPRDLVFVSGWVSHLESGWDEPLLAGFRRRLASFSRLIRFDIRGTGLSDSYTRTEQPSIEQQASDLLAVADAVGAKRPAVMNRFIGPTQWLS